MAIGVRVELPAFLHIDSLDYETSDKVARIKKKYPSVQTDKVLGAEKKLPDVIRQEVYRCLDESNIKWNFGDQKATMLFDHEDERIHDEDLGDEIIATVADVVQSALFITTSALEALYAKEQSFSVRA